MKKSVLSIMIVCLCGAFLIACEKPNYNEVVTDIIETVAEEKPKDL